MEIKNATWFEAKISYMKKLKKKNTTKRTSELYVVNALSFTEAEVRITACTKDFSASGEGISITALKFADYGEIIFSNDENDDRWYKVKLAYITLKERSAEESRTYVTYLVQAANIDKANAYIKEMMSKSMADYAIEAVQETKIMDVFDY